MAIYQINLGVDFLEKSPKKQMRGVGRKQWQTAPLITPRILAEFHIISIIPQSVRHVSYEPGANRYRSAIGSHPIFILIIHSGRTPITLVHGPIIVLG